MSKRSFIHSYPQSSLQAFAVGVATAAEDVEVALTVVVCLGLGGKGKGKGKMGKMGIMMVRSSLRETVLSAVDWGVVCKDSQEKVVTWIVFSPATAVVLDTTAGPTQAEGGDVSLAVQSLW